jgi:hypothetical protein
MGSRIFYRTRKYKRTDGLLMAIRKVGDMAGASAGRRESTGKRILAEHLGIKVQSINNWMDIPRDRIMAVHMLTKIPLAKLAPDLFKDPR